MAAFWFYEDDFTATSDSLYNFNNLEWHHPYGWPVQGERGKSLAQLKVIFLDYLRDKYGFEPYNYELAGLSEGERVIILARRLKDR